MDLVKYKPIPFTNRGGEKDVKMVSDSEGKWFFVDTVQELVKEHFLNNACFDHELAEAVGLSIEKEQHS